MSDTLSLTVGKAVTHRALHFTKLEYFLLKSFEEVSNNDDFRLRFRPHLDAAVLGRADLLAIWLVGLLFPSAKRQNDAGKELSPTAQDILKARYARGELTAEAYQQMIQTIRP
jgi:hypothetical protein